MYIYYATMGRTHIELSRVPEVINELIEEASAVLRKDGNLKGKLPVSVVPNVVRDEYIPNGEPSSNKVVVYHVFVTVTISDPPAKLSE